MDSFVYGSRKRDLCYTKWLLTFGQAIRIKKFLC